MNLINSNVWFHDIYNNSWDLSSYKHFMNIESPKDFWGFHNNIDIKKGMYFIMKNGIKPLWEDPSNIKGAYYSLKADENIVYKDFLEISIGFITNTLLDKNNEYVTGVSVTKKNKFHVIKIWLKKDIDFNINSNYQLSNYDFICKSHQHSLSKKITSNLH
jgi:hypothetical protein